jgi:pimeloyl-ACP methyl ester carboxylesterase
VVDVNGIAIHYQQRGDGPDLVMVHGLATSLAFWWTPAALAVRAGFRVTTFDLRGHGRSATPASGYTVPDLAADLAGLVDLLGMDRIHLVGHSLGGEIAASVAVARPQRVSSLTLADTRVRALQPENRWSDWPNRRAVADRLRSVGIVVAEGETETGQRLLEDLARSGQTHLVHQLSGDAAPPSGRFGIWGRRAAAQWLGLLATTSARADFAAAGGPTEADLRAVTVPVFGMYGEWSPCLPTLQGLQRVLPGCRHVVIPQAGHFHPVTRPAAFVAVLLSFLQDCAKELDGSGVTGSGLDGPRTEATRSRPVGAGTADRSTERSAQAVGNVGVRKSWTSERKDAS